MKTPHPALDRGAGTKLHFLWLAIAAVVTGQVLLGVPELGWQYQLMIFSGLAVVSTALFRRYQRQHPVTTDQLALNRRGEQYIGRTFTLEQPIVNRVGILQVDDSTWRITGDDLPAGTRVTVTGVDGGVPRITRTPLTNIYICFICNFSMPA